ncbi:hypothetical protein GCM10027447_39120 [Glycomyces halotolerans]
MADPVMLTDRSRPAIRVERRYDHPIDHVWRAVTGAEHLAQWFPAEAEFELEAGADIRFGARQEEATSGRVLGVDPPKFLAFTWEGDRLDFRLVEEGDQTVFVLTHHFDDRAGAASFATGWEMCLAALGSVLDGEEPAMPGPNFERHEELAERFGLGDPEVTRTEVGWSARFERQLICPAETAWDLFFGADPETGAQRRAPEVGEEFRPTRGPESLRGIVTEVDAPRTFAFDVAEGDVGDKVRLRLGEGTGHGARLFLEVDGGDETQLDAAIEAWGSGAVAHVAREASRTTGG